MRDALEESGGPLLPAPQMRTIAASRKNASRKKTERCDAYWIGRSLQTGMHPHPVYLPSGAIREIRARLSASPRTGARRRRAHE